MRTVVIVLAFLFSGSISVKAQEYVPMLDGTNEWKQTNCFFGCLTDTYFTDGDTIVDGKSYKILDGYHYISRGFLLHEDTTTKQISIKMYLPSGVEDYLLYDFSLEEGDTFNMSNPITPFPSDGGSFDLDSIRSIVLADNNPYRHFYFSPSAGNTASSENAVWIEGIGSLSIINAPGGHPDINGVGHLSCYFKNGNKVYENLDSITKCTPDILSVYDIANPLDGLAFYKKEGTVYIEKSSEVRFISVYAVNGTNVLNHANIDRASKIGIATTGLAQGLYLMQASDHNGHSRTYKFVVD